MAVNYKAELVGVLGYPVAENPTCVMQEAAFAALGLNWRYLTMEVKPKDLADAMRGVRALGMRGINLTIPHKIAVMPLLDDIATDAQIIGAVNTVYREGDRLIGANTDGKGFLRGLRERGAARSEREAGGRAGRGRRGARHYLRTGFRGRERVDRDQPRRGTRPAVGQRPAQGHGCRRAGCALDQHVRGAARNRYSGQRHVDRVVPRRGSAARHFDSTRRKRICSCAT